MNYQFFWRRIIGVQTLLTIVATAFISILVPRLILVEGDTLAAIRSSGLKLAPLLLLLVTFFADLRIQSAVPIISTLQNPTTTPEPIQLQNLDALPLRLALQFFFITTAISFLLFVPILRPPTLSQAQIFSVVSLAIAIYGSTIPLLYNLFRSVTCDLIEHFHHELTQTTLDSTEQIHEQRLKQKIIFSILVPALFVSITTSIVVANHTRINRETIEKTSATILFRTAFDALHIDQSNEKIAEFASRYGYTVHIQSLEEKELPVNKEVVSFSLISDQKRFTLTKPSTTADGIINQVLLVFLFAIAINIVFGRFVANTFSSHLVKITDYVRSIRAHENGASITNPTFSRFAPIERIYTATTSIQQEFQRFTTTQEQILSTKRATHELRGLLFASVSHDLKSPLNSILGFAELLEQDPLTESQRESLRFISIHGRELLALIQTILDAARIDAGQLPLDRTTTTVDALLKASIETALDLSSTNDLNIEFDEQSGISETKVYVDVPYTARAIGVVFSYAMRNAGTSSTQIRLTIRPPMVCFDFTYRGRPTSRSAARSLSLHLARSIIALHSGEILYFSHANTQTFSVRLPIAKA